MTRRPLRGRCPACKKVRRLTRHHVYPQRWYKDKEGYDLILPLCNTCHRHIELVLEYFERAQSGYRRMLSDMSYAEIARLFIKEQYVSLIRHLERRSR